VNTPRGQDAIFDEKSIRRAAVLARIPTITTIAAAQAAADGIAAVQRHHTTVYAIQELHASSTISRTCDSALESLPAAPK
jgi:carbamoyl-phosphate synthase large subunit